jgi:hypothetical protein
LREAGHVEVTLKSERDTKSWQGNLKIKLEERRIEERVISERILKIQSGNIRSEGHRIGFSGGFL